MWDGTLQFYMTEQLKGLPAFFEQANEHRIILSKILFWLDYKFFGGLSYLLIPINVLLMFLLWGALSVAARYLFRTNRQLTCLASMLIAVPCFSWLQAENINWGYQSQFYLAYLLPLAALMSMAIWTHDTRRMPWFVAAIVLGILSTVSMANGLLALPLLIAMLALSGKSTWFRMLSLIIITVVTFALWKHHYVAMPHPAAPLVEMVKFLLMFLGAPFAYIFHCDLLTLLVGATVIGASLYLGIHWLCSTTRDPMYLALVLFAAHVGAAGVAATIGRTHFGLGAALAGRYETPILLLYSTLFLLFTYLCRERLSTIAVVRTLSIIVPLVLFSSQIATIDAVGRELARQKMQSTLALDLGVRDMDALARIYPEDTVQERAQLQHVTANAIQANISVFGLSDMKAVRDAIGKTPASLGIETCHTNIDAVDAIPNDPDHVRLRGWAFDERTHRVPKVVYFVEGGIVAGAALTGMDRKDVESVISHDAVRSGFQGYAITPKIDNVVFCGESVAR